jgi:hypothetical protein
MTSHLLCHEAVPNTDEAIAKELYQFKEKGTWVENIAVRRNGNLIVVLYDRPEIFELILHESSTEAKLLWKGKDPAHRTTGITEISEDIFAFVVVTKIKEYSVRKLDPSSELEEKTIELVSKVEGAGQLNGLTTLSPTVCLAADTKLGCIWRLNFSDPKKKHCDKLPGDVTMKGWPLIGAGINGIRYRDGFLYYTNTIKGYLARIPIDPVSAEFIGPAENLVKDHLVGIDDFALGRSEDEFFVALGFPHSRVMRISLGGKQGVVEDVIAGGMDGVEYPTSVQFGRTSGTKNTIYVTTSGNPVSLLGVNWLEGGKVFAIKL